MEEEKWKKEFEEEWQAASLHPAIFAVSFWTPIISTLRTSDNMEHAQLADRLEKRLTNIL